MPIPYFTQDAFVANPECYKEIPYENMDALQVTPMHILFQEHFVMVLWYPYRYKGYPPHHGEGYEGRVSLTDQASLNLTNVQQSDQGLFECKVVYLNRGTSARKNGTLLYLEVLGNSLLTYIWIV